MLTVKDFLDYMRRSKYSPDTIQTYGSLLQNFEAWLDVKNKSFDDFTVIDLQEYGKTVYSSSSANTLTASVKAYLKYRVGSLPMGDARLMAETYRENQMRLIRPERTASKIRKKALTVEELIALIKRMKEDDMNEVALCGAIVTFYFGARPSELAVYLKKAKIDWKDRSMIIVTAKRSGSERYLVWHPKITPFLERWYESLDSIPYPEEWVTKRINRYSMGGLKITSRVARRTFQTNMRTAGVEDFYIDMILGHVSKSPIADVYTDYSDPKFKNKIREVMCDKHYMITGKVI